MFRCDRDSYRHIPAKAPKVATRTNRPIFHRSKVAAADPFDPLLEPLREAVAFPVVVAKDMPAAFVGFEIVDRELHRLETQPLRGRGIEPELVDMNLRWRAVLGSLEVDELDAAVSPVRAQHQVDAAVDAGMPERNFKGNLGADGAAELVAVVLEIRADSPSNRVAELLRGHWAGEGKVEGAGEDGVDVQGVRLPSPGGLARELRGYVMQELSESELARERWLESTNVAELVLVAALLVRDEAREVGIEWLGRDDGGSWCGRRFAALEGPVESGLQVMRHETRRPCDLHAVLLEPAHDQKLFGSGEGHIEEPRLVLFPARVALLLVEIPRDVGVLFPTHHAGGKSPLDERGHERDGKLETLGLVDGHDLDGALGIRPFLRSDFRGSAGEMFQVGTEAREIDLAAGGSEDPLFGLRFVAADCFVFFGLVGRASGDLPVERAGGGAPDRVMEIRQEIGHLSQAVLHGLDAIGRDGGAGKAEDLKELVVDVDDVVDAFGLHFLTEPLDGFHLALGVGRREPGHLLDLLHDRLAGHGLPRMLRVRVPAAPGPIDEDAGQEPHLRLGEKRGLPYHRRGNAAVS